MKHNILETNLIDNIAPIISEIINLETTEVKMIYSEMKKAVDKNEWSKKFDSVILGKNLSKFKESKGLGIDFPIWVNWETDKSKTMIVARDPQRNDNDLIIGSPFSVSSLSGRETKKNKYW